MINCCSSSFFLDENRSDNIFSRDDISEFDDDDIFEFDSDDIFEFDRVNVFEFVVAAKLMSVLNARILSVMLEYSRSIITSNELEETTIAIVLSVTLSFALTFKDAEISNDAV